MPSHRKFATAGLASVIAMIALGTSSAHAKTCWPYGTITATAGIAVKNTTAKKIQQDQLARQGARCCDGGHGIHRLGFSGQSQVSL